MAMVLAMATDQVQAMVMAEDTGGRSINIIFYFQKFLIASQLVNLNYAHLLNKH